VFWSLFFLLYVSISACALELTFVASCPCTHSPLGTLGEDQLLFIGQRSRFSTCTGVAWFPGQPYLISAGLIHHTLQTFHYDSTSAALIPLEFFPLAFGTQILKPENLSFSPDGTLLAVANGAKGNVTIYSVHSHTIDPIPIAVLQEPPKTKIHCVRFSPSGEVLACITFDDQPKISLFHVVREGITLSFSLFQTWPDLLDPLKPKGISFSPDGRFIAICYSRRAVAYPNQNTRGAVEIYAFSSKGMDPVFLSRTETGLCVPEDIVFDPQEPYFFVSNQGNDTITVYAFDPQSGVIDEDPHFCLKNPEAQLSFPHGISISQDGGYLASSNYGDDKVTIYKINRDPR
jgi:6-phosphogluconolactonase (cycloisomerase 2 family)